jgi:hypothetical protein
VMSDFVRFPTRRRLLAAGAFAASGFVFHANSALPKLRLGKPTTFA